jgi:hypothetical protein
MDRSRTLDRQYRRILYGGLALSAAAHVGFLALRFTAAPLPAESSTIAFQPAGDEFVQPPEARIQLIQFASNSSVADAAPISDAAPALPEAASASAVPVAVIESGAGAPVASAAVAEIAFERIPVMDPLSGGEISPIVFTDLPAASAGGTELEEGEADVPVYVPGSIGRAKRNWAGGNGASPEGQARGAFVIIGGSGGHCPMPGRAPPIWK